MVASASGPRLTAQRRTTSRKVSMRVLACFLFFSMMGAASEVLYLAGKNFIKGRFGGMPRKLSETSGPTQAQVDFGNDGMSTIEANAGGLESEQA